MNAKYVIPKGLLFLLAFLMLAMPLSCQSPATNPPTNDSETESDSVTDAEETTTEPEEIRFLPKETYTVVYGTLYAGQTQINSAVGTVRSALSRVYGLESYQQKDIYSETPGDYEILIGDTSRVQSIELKRGLGLQDYTYLIESEQVIVIIGGSPQATLAGVERFCEDQMQDGAKAWTVGASYTYRAEYSHSEVTLNGIPLRDYSLSVTNVSQLPFALAFAAELGKYTGDALSVVMQEDLTGTERGVIAFGAEERETKKDLIGSMYRVNFYEDTAGQVFCINASNPSLYETVIKDVLEMLVCREEDGTVELQLQNTQKTYYAFESTISKWTELMKKEEQLAEGAVYREYLFTDENRLPYRAYVLMLDPSKFTLYMGTADDGYAYGLTEETRQTVAQHMQARMSKGYDVLAGVNADFFASGDFHPCGLAIKEGVKISNTNDRPFFGVRQDGSVVIGSGSSYSSSLNLRTAVGGSDIIVKNGMPNAIGQADTYGDIHPRTLAGVTADGRIILVVIDGRQPAFSNGATLAHCAKLMIELGAVDAINLDGGGSSTMVIKDTESGDLNTMNKPSDGTMRRIYNSLLVIPVDE